MEILKNVIRMCADLTWLSVAIPYVMHSIANQFEAGSARLDISIASVFFGWLGIVGWKK